MHPGSVVPLLVPLGPSCADTDSEDTAELAPEVVARSKTQNRSQYGTRPKSEKDGTDRRFKHVI